MSVGVVVVMVLVFEIFGGGSVSSRNLTMLSSHRRGDVGEIGGINGGRCLVVVSVRAGDVGV